MKKRFSTVLIVLMTLSLIGIICIQGYWISNAFKSNKDQFAFSVKQAMNATTKHISEREFLRYFTPLKKAINTLKDRENKNAILLLKAFHLESSKDSIVIYKKRSNKQIKNVLDSIASTLPKTCSDWNRHISIKNEFENLTQDDSREFLLYEELIRDYAKNITINQRVNSDHIKHLLSDQLNKRGIDIDFEFAIFENKKQSSVASKKFTQDSKSTFTAPIFSDDNDKSVAFLWVTFEGKKGYIWSKIAVMVILSALLVLVILCTYFFAFNQIKKQRKISQIKSDFLNNMTHELKTPIASINLALDFMKNPKVLDNVEMRERYLNMIRAENERIHSQVDSVIRITRLGKKEINIDKEKLSFHDVIKEAVGKEKVSLENLNGVINLKLRADEKVILASKEHLTNVITNILDNAIKYSENAPKIDVYTENSQNSIILKVTDQGIGIDKSNQNKIFDKFFRIHTGDIHNVKGYGLGLSYAKYIIEDHQGEISVESTKGKGTIFTIKLPLTT